MRGWITCCDPACSLPDVVFERSHVGVDIYSVSVSRELGYEPEYMHMGGRVISVSDCCLSDKAFSELEPLWGRYVWGLT